MGARLQGKVAVVTGAAGTIGSVTARRLHEEGALLVLVDRPEEAPRARLEAVADGIDVHRQSVLAVPADIRDQDALDAAFGVGAERFGHVDTVFANAGVLCRSALTQRLDVDDGMWQEALQTNVTGTWRTVRAAAPRLREAGGGAIVITSSIAGIRGGLNNAAYSATKHAVLGIAKTAAHELGRFGIRVNSVLPTGVHTPMFVRSERIRQARPDLPDPGEADAVLVWSHTNLLGVPWIEAIDVANAVLFLASDEARYITGVGLPVDAGQSQLNPFAAVETFVRDAAGGQNL
jgi:(+)-trans-carveol dehydrogenase